MKRIALAVALLASPATPGWAGFDEGRAAYALGDYGAALRELKPLAEQGDARAQFNLAIMYDRGEGVAQDYAEAVTWYRRAARQGHALAQSNLGVMYHHGLGVRRNYAEAQRWYRRAAKQDDAEAPFYLGIMYHRGEGVPLDYGEAAKWYLRAADRGSAKGQFSLGVVYSEGQGVPQDNGEALTWYALAAAHGVGRAIMRIGAIYQEGVGVPRDLERAFAAYHLAITRFPPGPEREQAALKRDQVAHELSPEQLVRGQELAQLWSSDPDSLRKISRPPAALVAHLQQDLTRSGYDPGPADGLVGPKTRAAIRAFQIARELPVTGKFSRELLRELEKALAD